MDTENPIELLINIDWWRKHALAMIIKKEGEGPIEARFLFHDGLVKTFTTESESVIAALANCVDYFQLRTSYGNMRFFKKQTVA